MRRLWLMFAQAVTVALALLFVVSTLKPEWIGRAPQLKGLAETHVKPGFATLSGLVLYAAADPIDIRTIGPSYTPTFDYKGFAVVGRVYRALREYF